MSRLKSPFSQRLIRILIQVLILVASAASVRVSLPLPFIIDLGA